jgi:hypothetical protein
MQADATAPAQQFGELFPVSTSETERILGAGEVAVPSAQ